jgi:hypothetical protein
MTANMQTCKPNADPAPKSIERPKAEKSSLKHLYKAVMAVHRPFSVIKFRVRLSVAGSSRCRTRCMGLESKPSQSLKCFLVKLRSRSVRRNAAATLVLCAHRESIFGYDFTSSETGSELNNRAGGESLAKRTLKRPRADSISKCERSNDRQSKCRLFSSPTASDAK